MRVFISYARSDGFASAERLYQDLSDYDLDLWMDVHNIPKGANWDNEVQKGLDISDIMLVLLSPDSVASQNVADEWSYFIEKDKPIVPLLIAPCDVPFRLSRRQRVDFTGDYESAFRELIKSIGSPKVLDPDSTQRIRVQPAQVPPPHRGSRSTAAGAGRTPSITYGAAATPAPPVAPEIGVRMLPVVWAESYHWYYGMRPNPTEGDAMINGREIGLIPQAAPILTIPLQSLIRVRAMRSIVDNYLKITYYGAGGAFESLVLMGAPKNRRKQINEQIVNLLKLLTGRSLD